MRLALIALLLCPAASANPLGAAWHWAGHHKELLAADALTIAAYSADAASTRYAEKRCPYCIETNPFIPGRPSAFDVWGVAGGYSGAAIALNGLIWRYAPEQFERHAIWLFVVPVVTNEAAFAVPNNIRAGERK